MEQAKDKQSLLALQSYIKQRRGIQYSLEKMPEKAELIGIYINDLITEAKQNPYLCEMVVRSNQKDTGVLHSKEQPFQYSNTQKQKVSLENAFAISLVAEGINLAQKYQLNETVEKLRTAAMSPLLPPSMISTLKELGYVTPQKEVPLYCDHGGVIVVEGERQGSRYNYPADINKMDYLGGNLGIHYEVDFKEETTLGNTDLEDKLLPKSRVKSRNGENTGLFHIPSLFRIESTTQPEGI